MNTFEYFIEQEKIYSDKFLKNLKICDNNFDIGEYCIIKNLWKNQSLIEKIYNTIDDVLKKEKLNKNLRFLIIGDLFFSVFINNSSNINELIFKVSRNDYIRRISLRAAINIDFGCHYYKYVTVHQKLLIGLRQNEVISRSLIKNNTIENGWETMTYFIFKIDKNFPIIESFIGFSKNPFTVVLIYNVNYSVSSFRNIWKTKRKKREMVEIDICYDGVVKANRIGFILSKNLYKLNEIHIIKNKKKLLDKLECSTFEEYFIKLEQMLVNRPLNLFFNKNNELRNNKKFIEKKNNLFIYFQKIMSFKIINKEIFDKIIYLPCFMDNRGRQYYGTAVSPTFNVMLRHLYEFNIKKDFLNLKNSIFYNKIIKYKYLLEKFNLDDKKLYILIILFIEVGKFFLKKSKEYMIKTEIIINLGIKNYEISNIDIDFNDILYVEKIYFTITNLIKYQIIDYNTIIFKDATASGLQNYGILRGYKKETLKYLNIDNDEGFCDTYLYLMHKFLEDKTEKFWKREYWKNTIMTIPYNSVWFSCFNKFIDKLKKNGIEYDKMRKEEKKIIIKLHKNFYTNIKNNIKNEFYCDNKTSFNVPEFKYDTWKKVKIEEYKINYSKTRDKYTSSLYMLIEDSKTSESAAEANTVHYLDALLVKKILAKLEVMTIHDNFGVRLCELHLMMDEINTYYSEIIGMETYSIFILI